MRYGKFGRRTTEKLSKKENQVDSTMFLLLFPHYVMSYYCICNVFNVDINAVRMHVLEFDAIVHNNNIRSPWALFIFQCAITHKIIRWPNSFPCAILCTDTKAIARVMQKLCTLSTYE